MDSVSVSRVSSGLEGLDELLEGGFVEGRSYMVTGEAGTGKTILGYHFLQAGIDAGEETLYVAFEEPESEARANARTLGFDLGDLSVLDLSPDPDRFLDDSTYSVLSAGEAEGRSVAERVAGAIDEVDPDRVFVDPLTQLRHFTPDDYQFKQTAAGLMSHLRARGATVLFTAQAAGQSAEDLQYLADGAVELRHCEHGRSLRVLKSRGSGFQGGRHAIRIDGDGMHVFPSLLPGEYEREFAIERIPSGVQGLDDVLGGGIERGTVTVISGPSGVGKTTTGTTFVTEAARRGEHSAIYLFEETRDLFRYRSEQIGIPVGEMVEDGTLRVEEVEPLALSADEFAHRVRDEVEANETRVVMIDGTAGYRLSLQDEDEDLVRELHSLCRYLKNVGVTVVLIEEVEAATGEFRPTSANISYLADNILFLRYLEVDGEIRKAMGVLKKRFSDFEPKLRSFRIGEDGLSVGEPLEGLRGILTGTPEWVNDDDSGDKEG